MGYIINLFNFEFLFLLKRSVFLKAYLSTLISILFINKLYYNIYLISYLFLVSFFFLIRLYKEDENIKLFYIVYHIPFCLIHRIKVLLLYFLFLFALIVRLFVIKNNFESHMLSLISITNASFFIGIFCNLEKNSLKILVVVFYFTLVNIVNYFIGIYLSVLFMLIVISIFVKGIFQYERTN